MLENFVFDLGRRHRPDADTGNTIVMQNRQYIFACLFDRSNIHNALPVIRHAPGKGSCYIVAVGGEDLCVCAIDKAGFHQHGRHGGLAQDAEGGIGFDAAIFVAWVEGGEGFYELVLDGAGEPSARAVEVVAVGFGAAAAAGVDVDADEDIGGPAIGLVYDARVAGTFTVEVMALEEAHLAACRLQVFAAEGAVG